MPLPLSPVRRLRQLKSELLAELQKYKPRAHSNALTFERGDKVNAGGYDLRHMIEQINSLLSDLQQYRPAKGGSGQGAPQKTHMVVGKSGLKPHDHPASVACLFGFKLWKRPTALVTATEPSLCRVVLLPAFRLLNSKRLRLFACRS